MLGGRLFNIERAISGMPPEMRQHIRQSRAVPLVQELAAFLDATLPKLSGKSDLAGAIRYARSRWPALTRYLADGRLEISNNAAERAIRPLALNRKNWIFAGSDNGGERAAAIYTLIATAKLNRLNPRSLSARSVRPHCRLPDHPHRRSAALEFVAPLCHSGGMIADQIARLAIALDEVEPPVRRRIEVPLTIRLDRLHQVFQVVMGWENYHLYEFRIGRDIAYGVPDPNGDLLGSSRRPANRTTLAQLLAQARNNTFKYIYDFGDDWQHTVKLEAIDAPEPEIVIRVCSRPKAAAHPRMSVGRGAMPNISKPWPIPTMSAMPRCSNGVAWTLIPMLSMKPPSESS
jgi:hypothetical protein